MTVEPSMLELIKDWVIVPLVTFFAWSWDRNEKEHKAIRDAHEKLKEESSKGASKLNDKFMEHIDYRVTEAIKFAREEDSRLMNEMETQRGHIAKIFDKLEEHARRSEDRHVEMLGAIHEGLSRKADK
jgi:hypothetical protein